MNAKIVLDTYIIYIIYIYILKSSIMNFFTWKEVKKKLPFSLCDLKTERYRMCLSWKVLRDYKTTIHVWFGIINVSYTVANIAKFIY